MNQYERCFSFDFQRFKHRVMCDDGPYEGDTLGCHHVPGNEDGIEEILARPNLRDAAVLFALVARPSGVNVILTTRTQNLRSHSGQVALPGGRMDAQDNSPIVTALREAHEEIDLGAQNVEIIGRMPNYIAGSGYRISTIFGEVKGDPPLTPNPDEVADIFEVPLTFLMNPQNHNYSSKEWNGIKRFFWAMPYNNHHIWGVTAGIIRTIYERYAK